MQTQVLKTKRSIFFRFHKLNIANLIAICANFFLDFHKDNLFTIGVAAQLKESTLL